jgi:hypothetical protein
MIDGKGATVFSKNYPKMKWTVGENQLSINMDLPSVTYTVRFAAGDHTESQKVILVK